MDILVLQRKGLSQRQIARKLCISRNTVKKYIENQGYPERLNSEMHRPSLLDPFAGNIAAWLEEDMGYKATWIYDHLRPMGFSGSYEIVKRAVHEIKEERQRIAYMRFETEPGYQSQVDFGEFQIEQTDGTIGKIYLFSMILGFSRRLYAEFVDRCDLPTFLDCHIRAFDHFGGVTEEILYDRMKNVFIRKLAGKDKFNDTLVGSALWMQAAGGAPVCRLGQGERGEALSLHPGGILAGLRVHLPPDGQQRPSPVAPDQRPADSRDNP